MLCGPVYVVSDFFYVVLRCRKPEGRGSRSSLAREGGGHGTCGILARVWGKEKMELLLYT